MLHSIVKSEKEKELMALCEPVLSSAGFKLVDLECRTAGKPLIRLFIDKTSTETPTLAPTGTALSGPTLDECAQASRLLDPVLDAANLFESAYDLEVSSPGLDRRLRLGTDFEQVVGNLVQLSLVQSEPGLGAKVKADLVKVDGDKIVVGIGVKNRKEFTIPLANIKRAERVWQFESRGSR